MNGFRNSIKAKMIMIVVALIVGATVISGTVISSKSNKALERTVQTDMQLVVENVAERINQTLSKHYDYLDGLAKTPTVYNFLSNEMENKLAIISYGKEKGYSDVGFADIYGNSLTADLETHVDISKRGYIIDALAGKRGISDVIPDVIYPDKTIILLSVPVYENGDKSTNHIVGVLYAKMDSGFLSEITNSITFGETGKAYLVNSEGKTIAHNEQQKVVDGFSFVDAAAENNSYKSAAAMMSEALSKSIGTTNYSLDGVNYFVAYSQASDYNWHVLIEADRYELFGQTENQTKTAAAIIMVVLIAVASVIFYIYAGSMVKKIKQINVANNDIAAGDLSSKIDISTNTNDELSQLVITTTVLKDKLREVIADTKTATASVIASTKNIAAMVEQGSTSATAINQAVDDISQGSLSQASDVEKAASQIIELSGAVDMIKTHTQELSKLSMEANSQEKSSGEALAGLIRSNNETTTAINEIAESVKATNTAAERIKEAASAISKIASQTNLLSLNASIEAARAGDAGRGFAVVATEIQNLSAQSNATAAEIQNIIAELLAVADESEHKMNEVLDRVEIQHNKLEETRVSSDEVSKSVNDIVTSIATINKAIEVCANTQKNVEEIITNLSAISEENAAGTEETTASMGELSTNMQYIADAALELSKTAHDLESKTDFWRISL